MDKKIDYRFEALWRFGTAITILNILGHTFLGFEQSWAQPVVSVLTAYAVEIFLEVLDAKMIQRSYRFLGGPRALLSFMLPAHITGLAVAMLLYSNDRITPIIFASVTAVASKAILRVKQGKQSRHFLNPSNIGITMTLLLFPWVGIAPPYHFTENLVGIGDWLLPGLIVITGTLVNSKFTRKMPLILSWLGGFILQAVIRSLIIGTPIVAALLPMTGLAFVLFTLYMITDPGTTPIDTRSQIIFGLLVATVYGLLTSFHVVFGLFFSLSIVSALRGFRLYLLSLREKQVQALPEFPIPAVSTRRSE